MPVFKCKMCGGTIEIINGNETVGVCEYCGSKQTLPRLDDDKKANLYDRADHYRRNNDYDKAMGIYEQILNEDKTDAEAYWSLVLCRYGIEYVEDPSTHKRIPTTNRAQFTSVLADEDYKSALKYADISQKIIYEQEAKTIDDIQKGILQISSKEDPFDVFICYKETDNNGRRTQDSVLATDLYHQLTQEGFKVFFSRITLEDKLGTAYEPYIFAALNSAKVMVVLGTKPEYFNAAWVKNEWSRYLSLVKKSNGKKVLIPAYRDMDPYDLPEEFSHLQAQDMSKLGFMQDLIRGIRKVVKPCGHNSGQDSENNIITQEIINQIKKATSTYQPKEIVKEKVVIDSKSSNVVPLLERAYMFLEDRKWHEADEYCERVLDQEPKNSRAYLGKLMAELHVSYLGALEKYNTPLEDSEYYKKTLEFSSGELRERLIECAKSTRYYLGKELIESVRSVNDVVLEKVKVATILRYPHGYFGNDKKSEPIAKILNNYVKAIDMFEQILDYKDARELSEFCSHKLAIIDCELKYNNAVKLYHSAMDENEYKEAAKMFQSIVDYKNSKELIQLCLLKAEKCNKYFYAHEIIRFGSYPQSKDGKTLPIEWIVLHKDEDKVLVVSKYALAYVGHGDRGRNYDWKGSLTRKWLNSTFIDLAFSLDERERIIANNCSKFKMVKDLIIKDARDSLIPKNDKIFMLSRNEAFRYFNSRFERQCEVTEWVREKVGLIHGEKKVYWKLRPSLGYVKNYYGKGWNKESWGSVDGDGNFNYLFCGFVRPAMWIRL